MAKGTNTFEGLAVPLYGESEIVQQTAANDILTLTGAESMEGDFLSLQQDGGTEVLSISKDGSIDFAISSTTATNYGIQFSVGVSGVVDALIKYEAGITGATTAVFQVSTTNGPSHLLSIGTSAGAGIGAATTNGFFRTGLKYISAPSTLLPLGAIKMLAGSKAYYILAVPDTGLA